MKAFSFQMHKNDIEGIMVDGKCVFYVISLQSNEEYCSTFM